MIINLNDSGSGSEGKNSTHTGREDERKDHHTNVVVKPHIASKEAGHLSRYQLTHTGPQGLGTTRTPGRRVSLWGQR